MTRSFAFASSTVVVFVVGCGQGPAPAPALTPAPATSGTSGTPAEPGVHSHGAGPHGGAVADWGGGAYHVEFTVDHDKKEATVYILGGDEKTPAPIKAERIHLALTTR